MNEVRFFPPNGIIFIDDPSNRELEIPEYVNDQTVAATASCISVATRPYVDGDVTVRLSDSASVRDPSHVQVFSGKIHAPRKRIAVVTAEDVTIFEVQVQNQEANVTIWVDDQDYPSIVSILAV